MRADRLLTYALTLAGAVAAMEGGPAPACQCPDLPPCQVFWEADAVFAGKVLRLVDTEQGQRARFEVQQAERGVSSPTIDVDVSSSRLCGPRFQTGERYVVYAHRSEQGRLWTGTCSRAPLAAGADEDFAYFRELKRPSAGGRIFGSVRHQEPNVVAAGTQDRGPVSGLTIALQGPATERQLTTDADGSFEFAGLVPGAYTLTLRPPDGMLLEPHLSGVYETKAPGSFTIRLRGNRAGCMPIGFSVRERGGIRGVLVDHTGAPLEGELVHAIAAANAGTPQHAPLMSVRTGAGGAFEFTPLPSAQYVIGIHLTDDAEPREFDKRVYHPGLRVPGEAALVTIDGARIVDAGTFTVPADPAERTFTGVVVWEDGTPTPGARLLIHGAVEQPLPIDADGRFRLTLPYGSHFDLRAVASRQVRGRMETAASGSTEIRRNDLPRDIRLVLQVD